MAGVTIGVAALLTTLSVMNGFQEDIQKKVIGAQAHVLLNGEMTLERFATLGAQATQDPRAAAVSPVIFGQAILNGSGRSLGVVLKGLDPEQEAKVNDLSKNLVSGSWDQLKVVEGSKLPGIVLGQEMAKNLGIFPGETVLLVSPQGVESALGLVPRMQRFVVVGLLKTGYYEFDSLTAYALLPDVRKFFGLKAYATGLEVRLGRLEDAEAYAKDLRGKLKFEFGVRTFKDLNQTLFAALRLEKFVMFTILTLIVLVAAFNIASNLILLTSEKSKDIGLLKAMGATPKRIRKLFWLHGTFIGAIGVTLGVALGLLLTWVIGTYPIVELPADIYYLSRVPVAVEGRDVLAVIFWSLVLCQVSTLYPALRASKVDPIEAIHYG